MEQSKISCRTALITTSAFLTGIGILAIYASSSVAAAHTSGDPFYYLKKQIIVAAIGYAMIFTGGHLPFHWIGRMNLPFLFGCFGLLFLVHIPGISGTAGGATRWLLIGGFSVQPGELAKLAMIVFLAKNLSRPSCDLNLLGRGILPNVLVCLGFVMLLMLQPDFGNAALLIAITFCMLFVAGLRRLYLGLSCASIMIALTAIVFAAPYRVARLMTFLDPWSKIKTGGFQIIQSYVGFQNGGLFGAGFGESRQKLFFLPEAHTDFILSVIGEELGLIGVVLVCSLFAYLVHLGFSITKQQTDPFRKFLAFGLTTLIGTQALLNIGVTMGMLPTKGMTLPFVSNGANSLLVFLVVIAMLARISQKDQQADATAKR